MKFTVAEVAALLGGVIEGDSQVVLNSLGKIEEAGQGDLCFLSNPKYIPYIYDTGASAVIIAHDFIPEKPVNPVLIRVADPYSAFTQLLELASNFRKTRTGTHSQAFVHETAKISEEAFVDAFAYISEGAEIEEGAEILPGVFIGENVIIGAKTIIHPGAVILQGCKIGQNCIIHSGAVIGSDGFGFAPQKDGTLKKIPQTGIVVIEDYVEIGANACIDRATLGETKIRTGVKIDNLVQIAHNVEIGHHTAIASQTGVSGSTKIGKYCMIGGQVGFVGHITLADKTQVGGQSGVSKSVETEGTALRGAPAQPIREQLKTEALIRRLGSLFDQVKDLEKKIAILESRID
jgi:UDP-3-O-[3-hydroxymyristoyl] glucosamine N-acyltransferase